MILFNNEYDLNVSLISKTEKDIVKFLESIYKILPEDMVEDIKNNVYELYNYQTEMGIFKLDNQPDSLTMTRYQTAYDPFIEIKFEKLAMEDFKLNQTKNFAYLTTRKYGDEAGENNYTFAVEKIIEKSKEVFYVHISYSIKDFQEETIETSGRLKKFAVNPPEIKTSKMQKNELEL